VNELWQRLSAGADQLLGVLPSFLAAAAILVAGYFLAQLVERWTDALLKRLNFNKVAERGGLSEAMGRTGTRLDPIHAMGKLLFWLVMLVVILLASTALGLESINTMFGTMLSYIPTLIAAIVIVILGMIVGEFVRALVLASAGGVEGVPVLARLAKGAVVLISVFMAVQQLGVAAEIVTAGFTVLLGAVGLGAGLAFGLGNQKLAGEITKRWYEEGQQKRERRRREAEKVTGPGGAGGSGESRQLEESDQEELPLQR
jgi:mechanosensitive ion channel-like protein